MAMKHFPKAQDKDIKSLGIDGINAFFRRCHILKQCDSTYHGRIFQNGSRQSA